MSSRARPPGRRPGAPATRQEILAAARAEFAARGYRGATIRAIAARAGVDPALVHHYFGDKESLFAATVEIPDYAAQRALAALAGGLDGAGERLARVLLGLWEEPDTRDQLLVVIGSVLTHEVARDRMRGIVQGTVLQTMAGVLPEPERQLRIELAMTQILGMVLARHVIRVPPVCDLPLDDVVAMIAPVVQQHLTGPLPAR